jgi:putative FmdB family regulatory protein
MMPDYLFKCYDCDEEVEVTCTMSKRPKSLPCPKCGKDIFQHFGGRKLTNGFKDNPRESRAMGVHPSQIGQAMKKWPGSEYNPRTGRLKIRNRTEKMTRLRQRGLIEYD